tara:strand:+ start:726 stop:1037 length:312 start_codon:yes stop_codon:yes gene_type:complete
MYNMVYGKVGNFLPSRTLATFGDFGGFMHPEIPAGAIALPQHWWRGDSGGFLKQHTRPYRLPPAYTQNERIKKLLGTEFGDNGGTFNRVSQTPFHGPPRYTLQ